MRLNFTKKLLYFFIFILLLSLVYGFELPEGTVIDPTGLNLSAEIGVNTTVSSFVVGSTFFGFDITNYTFSLNPDSVINISSMNYTSNETSFVDGIITSFETNIIMNINGSDLIENFTLEKIYTGTVEVYYNGTLMSSTRDNNFSLNISSATTSLEIKHIYNDLWICDGRADEVPTLNFTIHNETNDAALTGNIFVDLTYLTNVLTYDAQNVHSLSICLGGNQSYLVSGTVRSDSQYVKKYILVDANVTNTLQNIKLYNFDTDDGLSTLEYLVTSDGINPFPNVIGRMQRYYPINHTWVTVQQDLTGQFGRLVFHVIEVNTDYRFNFYSNTTLLRSTEPIKFVCTNNLCQVVSTVLPAPTTSPEINELYTFDNDTNILTVTWDDTTGVTSGVNVEFLVNTLSGLTTVCNTTVSTSTGSVTCNATGYTGSGLLTIRSSSSPFTLVTRAIIDLLPTKLYDFLDVDESAIYSYIITSTIAFVGLTGSPLAVIMMTIIAIFIQFLMGMTALFNLTVLGVISIIGIIIAIKVNNQ